MTKVIKAVSPADRTSPEIPAAATGLAVLVLMDGGMVEKAEEIKSVELWC